jgi:hypothetical protein
VYAVGVDGYDENASLRLVLKEVTQIYICVYKNETEDEDSLSLSLSPVRMIQRLD